MLKHPEPLIGFATGESYTCTQTAVLKRSQLAVGVRYLESAGIADSIVARSITFEITQI